VLLPASREQINKLGKRLAAGDPVSDDDLRALEELAACHLMALELARPRLDGLAGDLEISPLHITHRPKTTQTILEKLRREHGMSLARVQDLAGIRIVGALRFDEQDRLAVEIMRRFPADPRPAKIVDRRANPSHGYRAVHVIVCLDGVTIEVQVRTLLQHVWADLMERLADRLGRQIRYGEPPVPPPGMSIEAAQSIVNAMMDEAAHWAAEQSAVQAMPLHVDLLTEEIWKAVSDALHGSGIAL
jgi:ppGpp synthetase/RelA/SpoT-type nucleotidyltranferase